MRTNVICPNCGNHSRPTALRIIRDDKNGNCFVDILFMCSECKQGKRVIRYTEKEVICPDNYAPCMESREEIHNQWIMEAEDVEE